MYPLVVSAKSLTGWISSDTEATTLSREDFYTLAKVGSQEGVINADEADAISALLAFRGLVARDVMTPRTVVASLPADICVGDISATDPSIRFSRIPIYADHGDDFIGFVRKDEIYREAAQDRPETVLGDIKHNFISVLDSQALPDLMQKMVDERVPISLIINEYGDPLGIATMEDLVETMLGIEIVDESDSHIDMQERARQLWRLRAEAAGIDLDPETTKDSQ